METSNPSEHRPASGSGAHAAASNRATASATNNDPAARCPHCRGRLGRDGTCPACSLRLGKFAASDLAGALNPTHSHHSPSGRRQRDADYSPGELAERFPQYEILNLIGRGGMGSVYRARQKSLDRMVAIKTIREADNDPAFAERFVREARALARLSHPNIVTVHDFGHTESLYFLVMEYVDGVNLRQAINADAFNPEDALRIVGQVCDALQYAHSHGVVHRDIKPENILLTEDGNVKIADFGLAKLLDENHHDVTLTGTRQIVGTLAYMAPEQIDNSSPVDHRADIYSLGVVFYELLTGHLPLGRFEPPSQRRDQINHSIDPVVMKTLSRLPAERYQAASELSGAVSSLSSSHLHAPPMREPSPAASSDSPAAPAKAPHAAAFGSADAQSQDAGLPPWKEGTAWAATASAKVHPDHEPPTSIPFKCEAHGGFATAHGLMRMESDGLHFEWKVKFLDMFDGDLKTTTVPWSKIVRLSLSDYLVTTRLKIVSASLTALNNLPASESGTLRLSISRSDVGELQRWLEWYERNHAHPDTELAAGPRAEWLAAANGEPGQGETRSQIRMELTDNWGKWLVIVIVALIGLQVLMQVGPKVADKIQSKIARKIETNSKLRALVGSDEATETAETQKMEVASEATNSQVSVSSRDGKHVIQLRSQLDDSSLKQRQQGAAVEQRVFVLTLGKEDLQLQRIESDGQGEQAIFHLSEAAAEKQAEWLEASGLDQPPSWILQLDDDLQFHLESLDDLQTLRSGPLDESLKEQIRRAMAQHDGDSSGDSGAEDSTPQDGQATSATEPPDDPR